MKKKDQDKKIPIDLNFASMLHAKLLLEKNKICVLHARQNGKTWDISMANNIVDISLTAHCQVQQYLQKYLTDGSSLTDRHKFTLTDIDYIIELVINKTTHNKVST